jgi:hypothetical protein
VAGTDRVAGTEAEIAAAAGVLAGAAAVEDVDAAAAGDPVVAAGAADGTVVVAAGDATKSFATDSPIHGITDRQKPRLFEVAAFVWENLPFNGKNCQQRTEGEEVFAYSIPRS